MEKRGTWARVCVSFVFPISLSLHWDVTMQLGIWDIYALLEICLKSRLQQSLKGLFMVLLKYLVTKCPC